MYIKEYDFFEYRPSYKKYSSIDFRDHAIEYVSYFLQEGYFNNIEEFLKKITLSFEYGLFQYFAITIDESPNLIYISNLYRYDYLVKDLSASKIIQLCHENSLEYNILSKDNFIHLLTTWNRNFDQLPRFVLLYQDDNDWFDVISFESQELMQKFIVDHTKKN